MLLSENIKYIHDRADADNVELQDYYKKMKQCKNTQKQRELIVKYEYD